MKGFLGFIILRIRKPLGLYKGIGKHFINILVCVIHILRVRKIVKHLNKK